MSSPVGGCRDNEEMAVHILYEYEAYSAYGFENLGQHLLEPWKLPGISVCCLLSFTSATALLYVSVWG